MLAGKMVNSEALWHTFKSVSILLLVLIRLSIATQNVNCITLWIARLLLKFLKFCFMYCKIVLFSPYYLEHFISFLCWDSFVTLRVDFSDLEMFLSLLNTRSYLALVSQNQSSSIKCVQVMSTQPLTRQAWYLLQDEAPAGVSCEEHTLHSQQCSSPNS